MQIPNLKAVGILAKTGDTLLWAEDKSRLHRIPDLSRLNKTKLIQIMGVAAYGEFLDSLDKDDRKIAVFIIQERLAEASREHYFDVDDTLGQGVWKLPNVDSTLLISGNLACELIWGDTFRVTKLNQPLYQGRLVELHGDPWITHDQLITTIRQIGETPQTVADSWRELVDALTPWSFSHNSDNLLVAGLAVATMIQGALAFRPQVWVSGPTNTGKSALRAFLQGFFLKSDVMEGETSAAGIKGSVGADALPVILDEQEPWYGSRAMRKLARSATRPGGKHVKGSPSGNAVVSKVNHILWSFSINTTPWEAADLNRYALFELRQSATGISLPSHAHLQRLGSILFVASLILLDDINERWRELSTASEVRTFGRIGEVLAMPIAVMSVLNSMGLSDTLPLLLGILGERQAAIAEDSESDEEDLIRSILTIDCFHGTVGQLVAQRKKEHFDPNDALIKAGVRRVDQFGRIFIDPHTLSKALRGTRWEHVDLKRSLKRLRGAEPKQLKFNGANCRGVLLPLSALIPPDEPPKALLPVQSKPSVTQLATEDREQVKKEFDALEQAMNEPPMEQPAAEATPQAGFRINGLRQRRTGMCDDESAKAIPPGYVENPRDEPLTPEEEAFIEELQRDAKPS